MRKDKFFIMAISLGMFVSALVLLQGCGGGTKTVRVYTSPTTPDGTQCVTEAKAKRASCKQKSYKKLEACKEKAKRDAVPKYEAAQEKYTRDRERFETCLDDFAKEWDVTISWMGFGSSSQPYVLATTAPYGMPYWKDECGTVPVEPLLSSFVDTDHCKADPRCQLEYEILFEECGGSIHYETR